MVNFWKLYTFEMEKIGLRYLMTFIAAFALNGIIFVWYKKSEAHLSATDSDPVGFLFSVVLAVFYTAVIFLCAMTFPSKSDYLPFSLPLRRSSILLAWYSAALTLLLVTFLVSTLWAMIGMISIERHAAEQTFIRAGHTDFSQLPYYHNDYWGFLQYESAYFFRVKALFLCSFGILGIIALTRSLRYVFRWFNKFLCDFAALILFIAFCWLGLSHLKPMEVGPESMINSMIAGIVFIAAGMVLFEKYGEV